VDVLNGFYCISQSTNAANVLLNFEKYIYKQI